MTEGGPALIVYRARVGRSAAIGLLFAAFLAACSILPASLLSASASPTPPAGDFSLISEVTPTVFLEPQTPAGPEPSGGGYPPPAEMSSESTMISKAVPPSSEAFPLFLPAIINQTMSSYPFELQSTGVMAIQGFYGCNWAGVAGQIFDLTGAPQQNLILHLEGIWAGHPVAVEALSGSASQYGPAGYEFILGSQTLDSTQSLWIQVLDAFHKEISAKVFFDTFNDCARNLILINFNQKF